MNTDWNSGTDPLADIEAAIARIKSDEGYVPAVYPDGFIDELLDMSRHTERYGYYAQRAVALALTPKRNRPAEREE